MKLQHVQAHCRPGRLNLLGRRVDKQTDRTHPGRKTHAQSASLIQPKRAGAARIKNEPDRIDAQRHRSVDVLGSDKTAKFDTGSQAVGPE